MGNAKVVRLEKSQGHEEIFLAHYDWLLKSARDLCHGYQEEAEDLVQDMYVNFVLSHAALDISDPDHLRAYLYRTLKNLYIRKSRRNRDNATSLTISDYDSIEIALSSADGNELLLVRSRLSKICEYARARRLSHKAASVLILRFFFGYFPSEIAKVFKTNRAAIDRLTHIARLEAKAFVTRPGSFHFLDQMSRNMAAEVRNVLLNAPRTNLPDDPAELKATLRSRILSWNEGTCLTRDEMAVTYAETSQQSPSTLTLAHMVTCRTCLDTVNEQLGIPSLDMHFSSDEGEHDDTNPPGSSRRNEGTRKRMRRKKREAFEHRPSQLNVAVNGQVLGTSAVSGELSEFQLSLSAISHPENIEVFSEQGITLLHFDLMGIGLDGVPARRANVTLSDERTMSLELMWGGDGLAVNISYRDLPADEEPGEAASSAIAEYSQDEIRSLSAPAATEPMPSRWKRLLEAISAIHWLAPFPLVLSTGIMLLAFAITVYYTNSKTQVAPTTPGSLLKQSLANEESSIPLRGALHRTFAYEVRQDNGQIVERGTVDSFRGRSPSRRALRLSDEKGRLIAGLWIDSQGKATKHSFTRKGHANAKPIQGEEATPWIHLPEADDFESLVGRNATLSAKIISDGYEIVLTRRPEADEPTVVAANLILTKESKRPIQETFRIEDHHRTREYRFEELKYEYVPAGPQLETDFTPPSLKPAEGVAIEGGAGTDVSDAHIRLEALMLLANLGPDVERIVDVERTPDGRTSINGVFETTVQKTLIERVFDPLKSSHHLIVDLHAADEPMPAHRSHAAIQLETLDAIPVESERIPFDAQLRSALTETGSPASEVDHQIHAIAKSVLHHSSLLHREGWCINQIASADFSTNELQIMLPEDRMLWLTLLDKHVREFESERASLELGLLLLIRDEKQKPDPLPNEESTITSVDELRIATQRFNQDSERLDRLLTAGFTLSASGPPANNNLEAIAQLIANLRTQESRLRDTVEHLQAFGQR